MSMDNPFMAATISSGNDDGFVAAITPLSHAHNVRHSSHISKCYRQASTLFLTRRLPEALSTVLPLVWPRTAPDTNALIEAPPVARASKSTRVKVWSLYLTILNAITELEPQEGKETIGAQDFRMICNKVRDGDIWAEVVKNGYHGVEGDVDAEVVINLTTLLLAHSTSQLVNQKRLEAYLSYVDSPSSLANKLDSISQSPKPQHKFRSSAKRGGAETPRELNARIKILELYTLHVLLRNDEWETSRAYINASPLLDEERREAFLQALQSLRDEQNEAKLRHENEQNIRRESLRREAEEANRRREENEQRERQRLEEERMRRDENTPSLAGSDRSSSTRGFSSRGSMDSDRRITYDSLQASPGRDKDRNNSQSFPISITGRAGMLVAQIKGMIDGMSRSLDLNVAILLKLAMFMAGVLLMLGRRDVREKVQRIVATGWAKVKATASMGSRVSSL
ncbi:hypothetical protein CFIMG_003457RA [Ceratocystis fimbriata CBS 114723]|uniref:Peroxin 26 n=1 Tax=Ceratocystis fimbriata CBS 114723 TaxID=1035309 RepID=A0A2C5XIB5_9PEZI|nr:hypothetical protein CFIMG_003457RA [Ceratocystis fimbriata CBS 114723]